ncbi:hypothetical protein [Kribbella sp. CA-247076]|uniref:hypothetical protein n=1 Tax=Kribbella sp. CA-247076 TaxID=3239941 RepID=UPI003D93A01B
MRTTRLAGRRRQADPQENRSGLDLARFVVEILGLIALVLALIYSARATSAARDAIEVSSLQIDEARYASVHEHQLNLWAMMVDKPDLAPYVVGDKGITDAVTDQDKQRATRTAGLNAALDFYAYAFYQLVPRDENDDPIPSPLVVSPGNRPEDLTPQEWSAWTTWAVTIVDGFRSSPGLCQHLLRHDKEYEASFVNAVTEVVGTC